MSAREPWVPSGPTLRHHLGVWLMVYGFLAVGATAPPTVLNFLASITTAHSPPHLFDLMAVAFVLSLVVFAVGWSIVRSERERRRRSHRLSSSVR